MDALVVEELPEVDDGGLVAGEELGQALGVPLVRQPLADVAGIGRIAPCLRQEARERLVARTGPPLVDVDAGRHLVHAVDVADDVLEHLSDVRRADEDGLCALERFPSPGGQRLVPAHRVLELGAVRLDRIAGAGCCTDRPAEEDVVAEDEVGRQLLAHGGRVALDPVVELGPRAVLHELDLVALVAVEHEDGQQPADVRPDCARPTEVVLLGVRLLGEDDDIVACARPLLRERPRVDVRAGAPEEVPVPEEDPQDRSLSPITG